MKPETKFQKQIKESLEDIGALIFNVHGGGVFQSPGWPDLQVYHKQLNCHIELKMKGGKLSPLQTKRIGDLVYRNVNVFLIEKNTELNQLCIICFNTNSERYFRCAGSSKDHDYNKQLMQALIEMVKGVGH
jgi:hypothetical protein